MKIFEVSPKEACIRVEDLQHTEDKIKNIYTGISGVKNGLNLKRQYCSSINNTLVTLENETFDIQRKLNVLKESLSKIASIYEKTENVLTEQKLEKKVLNNEESKDESSEKVMDFWKDFKSNLVSDITASSIESSGNFAVKVAGAINYHTAIAKNLGENGFVILNPGIASKTSVLVKAGNAISKGAKYGLPVIGGIFDFVTQKMNGEDTGDALVKSVVHTGIGVLGGKVGMAIGTAIFPGTGTVAGLVAGAAFGFVVGAVITTGMNAAFDYIYDNSDKIMSGIQAATDCVGEKVEGVIDGVKDTFEGIGNVLNNSFQMLGTVFG